MPRPPRARKSVCPGNSACARDRSTLALAARPAASAPAPSARSSQCLPSSNWPRLVQNQNSAPASSTRLPGEGGRRQSPFERRPNVLLLQPQPPKQRHLTRGRGGSAVPPETRGRRTRNADRATDRRHRSCTSRSRANWRTVSRKRYRRSPANSLSTTTSDLLTSRDSRSSTSRSSNAVAATHVLGGLERPRRRKHRQSAEQLPFGLRQQLVTPVHRRLECSLPCDGRSRAAGEQSESVLQPRLDLLDGDSTTTRAAASSIARGIPSRRRQIRAMAPALSERRPERRVDGACALDEELRGFGVDERVGWRPVQRLRERHRRDSIDGLAGHAERFAARRDNPQRRRCAKQRFDEIGAGAQSGARSCRARAGAARSRSASSRASRADRCGPSRMPSAVAIVCASRSGAESGARSTSHTPSGKSSTRPQRPAARPVASFRRRRRRSATRVATTRESREFEQLSV